MGLHNYTPQRHEMSLGGGNTIALRGLALEDISRLINVHLPDIEALFDLFASGMAVKDDEMRTLVMSIVKDAPGFAANMIALSADEPDHADKAEKLPAPLQIQIIMKIGDLTFTEVGGVKKGMEMLAGLLNIERIKKNLPGTKTKAG